MRRDRRLCAPLLLAAALFAMQAGPAAADGAKLPDRRTTPTGNFITLYSFGSNGSLESANVSICTSAHTPKGTEAIPTFFTMKVSSGATVYLSAVSPKSPALKVTPLGPKQCVRGWISFTVPKGTHATKLVYTYGKPITWSL